MSRQGQETLRGQVESVRLVRDGWGVLTVLHGSARERAEVTGHPLGVDVGDTVEVDGIWSEHPRFGPQFKARAIRVVAPSDASGAIEWMISRLPRVGRKLATEIVERWGVEGAWHVLENDVGELAQLRGITPERAAKIHLAYRAHLAERDRMVALKGWGLTDRQIARVLETWGERALEELRRDPYQLSELVDGFGFKRADDVAIRMGLPPNHPSRVRAALLHLLGEASGHGHVFVSKGKLVALTMQMVGVDEALVRREANALLDAEKIVVRGGVRVYRPALARAEQAVAAGVRRLLSRPASEGEDGERKPRGAAEGEAA